MWARWQAHHQTSEHNCAHLHFSLLFFFFTFLVVINFFTPGSPESILHYNDVLLTSPSSFSSSSSSVVNTASSVNHYYPFYFHIPMINIQMHNITFPPCIKIRSGTLERHFWPLPPPLFSPPQSAVSHRTLDSVINRKLTITFAAHKH